MPQSKYVFTARGGCISWSAKKQSTVALNTMEAELMALCSTVKHAIWLKKLCDDMNVPYKVIRVFEDNQACIKFTKSSQYSSRSKHIGVQYHFLNDMVDDDSLSIEYLPTNAMPADIFTKGLSRNLHYRFCLAMGMKF
jgi:hypothetical protein